MPLEARPDKAARYSVLVVSTHDVARSVAAQALLLATVGDADISVARAGSRAIAGQPPAERMRTLLQARGLEPAEATSTPLTAPMVRDADLVLAVARENRAAAVSLAPDAVRRSFTLRELARLASLLASDGLGDVPADADVRARLSLLVAGAPLARTRAVRSPEDDDVAEPRRMPGYRRALAEIDDAVAAIVAAASSPRTTKPAPPIPSRDLSTPQ
ncbi:low molecular weight phosphatase family protein [Georgenia sp. SYP-B2076]|uniref:arsenate-mycothiol transferase ArsC n=1 Tax=Georgenia sp. SYP-B2076 TaxID=2495881 RepID=UPI0013E05125|nr:low molecular weight phosphatase family protein [Georgenia sp. SYP-B2076]